MLLGGAIGLARGAGVTPWAFVPHLQRFWLRGFDGGGLRGLKMGPKEAQIDVVACPVFQSRYFRAATRGLVKGLFELVCRKAYVHDTTRAGAEEAPTLRVQWV